MADTVNCPLCRKDVTRPSFGKHVCSKAHHVELRTELRKMGKWDKSYCLKDDSNKLPTFTKAGKDYSVCFGCQKVYLRDNGEHLKSCKQKAEHKALLKDILGGDEGVELPAEEGPANAVAEETIRQLRAKVALLEKQVVEQAKSLKAAEEKEKEDAEEYEKLLNSNMKMNKLFRTVVGAGDPDRPERGPSYYFSKYAFRMWQKEGKFKPLVELLGPHMEDEDYDIKAESDEE